MSSWLGGKMRARHARVLDGTILAHDVAIGPIDADPTAHRGDVCFDEAGTIRGQRGG